MEPFAHMIHGARAQGLTLLELLVAIAVLAILLAVGVPSFQGAMASSRLTDTTNDLASVLAQARSEAIRRGTRVSLCKSSTGTSCATTGDWNQGWIVFVDTTRTGPSAVVDPGETVISVQGASPGTAVKGSANVESYVSFAADGRSKLMNGDEQSGTLRVCSTSGALTNANRARDITLTSVGRVASSTPGNVANTCPSPS